MRLRTVIVRTAAVAAVGLSLGACATPAPPPPDYSQDFAAINSRLDTLDMRVQEAIARADTAGQAAATANQRIDQLQRMPPPMPPRSPRG